MDLFPSRRGLASHENCGERERERKPSLFSFRIESEEEKEGELILLLGKTLFLSFPLVTFSFFWIWFSIFVQHPIRSLSKRFVKRSGTKHLNCSMRARLDVMFSEYQVFWKSLFSERMLILYGRCLGVRENQNSGKKKNPHKTWCFFSLFWCPVGSKLTYVVCFFVGLIFRHG